MAIYDFFVSRNGAASTPENYVGHEGRLFYDSATGEIRISDGTTAGGLPIPITIATSTTAGAVKPGLGFTVGAGGAMSLNAGPMFALDETETFNLLPATADRIGGVKPGPGVTINAEGQILIDSEGLEFSFGDFSGTVGTYTDLTDYALLQSLNTDEDIVIATNGTGSVNIVGELRAYATNTDITDAIENFEPIFRVLANGKVRMLVPAADTNAGAFEIIGNETGTFHPPDQTGVILHTTGNTGSVNRVYHDANNNYPIIVGRRYNGVVGALTQVLDGEVFFRIAGQASTNAGGFETFGPAKINWIATEDQTPTAQGGKITIDVTANGTTAFGNVITAAEFTATGVVSTVGFVGDLTGNASTVTNGVYTTDTGTVTNTMLAGSIANDKLANSTISGIALGSNLATLSVGNYLTGTGYNGSTARTFAVDATTAATASKVVARDANAGIAAATTTLAVREAGSFGAGQTITINMATDHYVHANITGETVTVAYTNITAGRQIYLLVTNATGGDLALNSGIPATRMTNAKNIENMKNGGTSRLGVISFGTTITDCYGNFEK